MHKKWDFVRIEDIKAAGGASDCYGNWIALESLDKKHPERSILAQLNQAREMWLLRPALDLALEEVNEKARPAWQITLLQHDGFSVHFTRTGSASYHLQRIQRCINKKGNAERLSYHLGGRKQFLVGKLLLIEERSLLANTAL